MVICEQCGNDFGEDRGQCPFCGARRVFAGGEGRRRRRKPSPRRLYLKDGLPTVDQARERLERELRDSRAAGVRVVTVIHGYGAGGIGGAIRPSVRGLLTRLRREGLVRAFIPGEDFNRRSDPVRGLLHDFPELREDPDLDRGNEGITVVLL